MCHLENTNKSYLSKNLKLRQRLTINGLLLFFYSPFKSFKYLKAF